MNKLTKIVAKKWPSRLRDTLLLIVLLPILIPLVLLALIIAAPVLIFESVWSRIRKEPHPDIPSTGIDSSRDSNLVAHEFAAKAKDLVNDVKINHDETKKSYILTTQKLGDRYVEFEYDHDITTIYIKDLNTYEWFSSSKVRDDLDLYFWIAVGALRNGVFSSRSKFGLIGYLVKCDELGVWVRVQKEGSIYDSILFYSQPPDSVEKKLN